MKSGQSIRQFCKDHDFDWGNVSKIERGVMAPPKSRSVLEKYALALGIENGSAEWEMFLDLAAAQNGQIPFDLQKDENLIPLLPALFRTFRHKKLSREKMKELAGQMRDGARKD